MQQQHWQQRRAHAPCTCRRTADILHGWNPQTLSRVICDDPTGRARVQAVLFGGATCSLLLPFPVILTSHHTPQKYEGTLCLFTPSNPAHHADPALVLDQVADALSRANPCSWAPLLLSGGAAGIIGWLGTFPFDVIKTRMQVYGISTGPGSSAGEGTLWRTA